MIKIVTVEEMRAIEAAAVKEGISYAQMMDNAGRAIADRVKQILEEQDLPDPRVAVLVGPGNNGGDGLVAGRLISEETKATVSFFLAKSRPDDDENFIKVRDARLLIADAPTDAEKGYRVLRTMVANADIVIDALLGTGAKLPVRGEIEITLREVDKALKDRHADRPQPHLITPGEPVERRFSDPIILAVDIPTGMDADTGELDKAALHADETITMEAAKVGLISPTAADAVGRLHTASLGLPEKLPVRDKVQRTLVDSLTVRDLLPSRPASANKGTFGKTLIVGGSSNYTGAPLLAAKGAYAIGTGLVTVAAPQNIIPILAANLIESTWLLLPHDLGVLNESAAAILHIEMAGYSAMLIGPGLGREAVTRDFLGALLKTRQAPSTRKIGFSSSATPQAEAAITPETLPPLVIDADGLNLLATFDEWWKLLPARTVLTPHPGEMARLAKIEGKDNRKPTELVQADRLKLAAEKAAEWNCIVVLKGAYTVIADPDGRVSVLPFATPALARAGTGDVLAGAITGLLAQGLDPFDAAVAAGYLHGFAGELAMQVIGTSASVLASHVLEALPDAIAALEGA